MTLSFVPKVVVLNILYIAVVYNLMAVACVLSDALTAFQTVNDL